MKLEVLDPVTNLDSVEDGRGGVFTWVPEDAIQEFNLVYLRAGKLRGNHKHPEFTEYFLVVDGSGVMVTRDAEDGPDRIIHLSRGGCTRCPPGVPHAFRAITDVTAVAMITKPWRDCDDAVQPAKLIDPAGS